jgi:hypothetical protein
MYLLMNSLTRLQTAKNIIVREINIYLEISSL